VGTRGISINREGAARENLAQGQGSEGRITSSGQIRRPRGRPPGRRNRLSRGEISPQLAAANLARLRETIMLARQIANPGAAAANPPGIPDGHACPVCLEDIRGKNPKAARSAVISIKHVSTFVNKVDNPYVTTMIFELIDKCRYVFYAYDGRDVAIFFVTHALPQSE
jgi:hypothetical protein